MDLYNGLRYLREKGVTHRDVKPANIFIHNGQRKLADFGLAKFYKYPPPLMLRNGPRDAHSKLLCGPTLDERRDPVYEFIDGDAQGPKIGLFTVVVEDESFG